MNTASNETSLEGQLSKKENVQPLVAHPTPGQAGACLVLSPAQPQPVAAVQHPLHDTIWGRMHQRGKCQEPD